MIMKSLQTYEKANKVFADAYCIQWRLGEKFYAIGNYQEAEKHYKRAFEMMPDQFGRIASLCFGCEDVFTNRRSQVAGEKIIVPLIAKYPNKPQVYYVMGLLREEQSRFPEAYKFLKKAVELDPAYFDAWEHLYNLADKVLLSQAERDALIIKMLQLDPLQRHIYGNLESVRDVKNLWIVLEDNQKYIHPAPESLYPLPASKAWIEKKKKEKAQRGVHGDDYTDYEDELDNSKELTKKTRRDNRQKSPYRPVPKSRGGGRIR